MTTCEQQGIGGNCGLDCCARYDGDCSFFESALDWKQICNCKNFQCSECNAFPPVGVPWWRHDSGSMELEPIREWSNDLVGRELVAIESSEEATLQTPSGPIKRRASWIIVDDPCAELSPEIKEKMRAFFDSMAEYKGPSPIGSASVHWRQFILGEALKNIPVIETTHSCTMKFPNGDIVDIPPPADSEWKEEVIFDEWTDNCANKKNNLFKGCHTLCRDNINHKEGELIFVEYYDRAMIENATVESLSKWTRTVTPTKTTENRYESNSAFPTETCISNKAKTATLDNWPARHDEGALTAKVK